MNALVLFVQYHPARAGARPLMQYCGGRVFHRHGIRRFDAACRQIVTEFPAPANLAPPDTPGRQPFVAHDQALAADIPTAHDPSCKFHLIGLQAASAGGCFLLISLHLNKGGTCRGPYLETECARCMRRVRFRRRGLAGGILSSRGQRRRQTNNCRCKTGRAVSTGEHASPVFCFRPRRCWARR